MKKMIVFLLLAIPFIISGCFRSTQESTPSPHDELNRLEGIFVKVNDESVSSTGLTLELTNDTAKEFTFGEAYTLEQKEEGEWYLVPIQTEDDYGFIDIGYLLGPQDSIERVLDWEWLYGSLEPGDYRLIMDILDVHEAGDSDTYTMSAEFTI